jgi:hypothetical protein
MSLTNTQRRAIRIIRTRLDPYNLNNNAHESIKEHLRAIRPYLYTWVLPLLDAMQPGASRLLQKMAQLEAGTIARAEGAHRRVRLIEEYDVPSNESNALPVGCIGYVLEEQTGASLVHWNSGHRKWHANSTLRAAESD